MNQNAIKFSEYRYKDLKENTFGQRLKKARLIAGYSQNELSKLVGLSKSYINDLEAGTQTHISKDNILKLHEFLDKELVMNDYIYFILNQKAILKEILKKHPLHELANLLSVHESTIQKWYYEKVQISTYNFNKLKNI
ncbi:helix-turn-helix transcriptional regulator [Clostridium sp.]|uniref:helix-turn-helix domain-containing protein n=1 Tax=Clostridium sp. TaxID=1506 RepID=UPI002622B38D|nr:helix-turn-helix transcriptional regulator [Clostridium sp.]